VGNTINLANVPSSGPLAFTLGPSESPEERTARIERAKLEHSEQLRQQRWRFNALLAAGLLFLVVSAGCTLKLDGEQQKYWSHLLELMVGGVMGFVVGHKNTGTTG